METKRDYELFIANSFCLFILCGDACGGGVGRGSNEILISQ